MKKGFTLIELLIVIAIIAILAAIVIIAINPAEVGKEARDAKRMQDLDSLVSAINLYLTEVTYPNLCFSGRGCAAGGTCTASTSAATIFGGSSPVVCSATVTTTTIDGTGWIDVQFSASTIGALNSLPLDPTNNASYTYAYKATTSPSLNFEIDTRLESVKYRDNMRTDGGNRNTCTNYTENTCWYEKGTKLDL